MTTTDALERLLHRAHREELLALARLLRVNPEGLGLGDLARVLAVQVRRVGSHGVTNIALRKGEGKPYDQVVADAATALGVPYEGVEATELALAHRWFTTRWDAATPDERARFWTEMGLAEAPPAVSKEAYGVARQRLGRSFDYALTGVNQLLATPAGWMAVAGLFLHPVGCLMRPLVPLLIPLIAWKNLKPSPEYVGAALLEVARIRQRVLHRVHQLHLVLGTLLGLWRGP